VYSHYSDSVRIQNGRQQNTTTSIGIILRKWKCLFYFSPYVNPRLMTVFLYENICLRTVRRSSASVCVCVCVCVCVRTINQNSWNYNHQTCHRNNPSYVLATYLISGQKVIGQSHRVIKCKNILRAIEWLAWVWTLSSAHRIVRLTFSHVSAICRILHHDWCINSVTSVQKIPFADKIVLLPKNFIYSLYI